MCLRNIHFVCTGQWGRSRFVKRGLGNLEYGIFFRPVREQLRGSLSKDLGWPLFSIYPVPISP